MPKFVYGQDVIEEAKKLRQCGYTYQEISDLTGMKMTTVIHHTQHMMPSVDDAHRPVWKAIDDLRAFLEPGTPFKQLPLPKGLLAYLGLLDDG